MEIESFNGNSPRNHLLQGISANLTAYFSLVYCDKGIPT